MRFEPLLDMELDYADGFVLIAPWGGAEGAGYGSGSGRVSGDRVSGTIKWSNHPHRRSDGVLMPDAHGVIETPEGARILFHLTGYSSEIEDEPARRRIVSPATFVSEDPDYRWLNDVVAVGEGEIDFRTLRLEMRYYAVSAS